jgi:hypothetical protein
MMMVVKTMGEQRRTGEVSIEILLHNRYRDISPSSILWGDDCGDADFAERGYPTGEVVA